MRQTEPTTLWGRYVLKLICPYCGLESTLLMESEKTVVLEDKVIKLVDAASSQHKMMCSTCFKELSPKEVKQGICQWIRRQFRVEPRQLKMLLKVVAEAEVGQ